MDVVLTAAGSVLVVIGALAFVTAGLGLIRFPDPYTRVSAVGTAGGVGMILIVVGALLLAPGVAAFVKVALIVVLQLGSASVAHHGPGPLGLPHWGAHESGALRRARRGYPGARARRARSPRAGRGLRPLARGVGPARPVSRGGPCRLRGAAPGPG